MLKLIKLLITCCIFLQLPATVFSQDQKKIFLLEIRNEIDPRMSRYIELGLKQATDSKADLVLINMDTYGGMVQDADKIVTMILNFPIPVHVWINDKAFSAGALIAISCDSIYMSRGATIGAATVVFGDGKPAPDKYQAAMRSKMRATAEAQNRNPEIAEGMVGKPLGDSLTIGKVLSLTTEEAKNVGYCDGVSGSIKSVLEEELNIAKYEIEKYEPGTIENIVNIFLNPYLQGILLLIMLGGIYFELQTPGVGFPILAAGIAAMLYFVPSYLTGLAESWEILLFIFGIGLIIIELFAFPGFGVAGVSGILLLCAGIVLVMLNNDALDFEFVPAHTIVEAFTVLFAALGGAIILIFVGGTKFLESKFFKKVMLEDSQNSKEGWTSNFITENLTGKTGTSYTVLRPSGKVMIDGNMYDAYSRGEYIEKGKEIEVISVTGTSVKVKERV